ncbi:MAG: VPDSG-CTERM sorting domain-containing protein, partial [Chthoniobacterales bacterium]
QDQLVLVPDSGATGALFGFGLLGLFLVNRKVLFQSRTVAYARSGSTTLK